MDGLSFHPYPNRPPILSIEATLAECRLRQPRRIKQALWDAFHGTRQRTTRNGLKLYLDEVGWQVDTSSLRRLHGCRDVPVTSETRQAAIYGELVSQALCDKDIAEVNIFGFYDNSMRDSGFQAGLNRVDGSPRLSAATVEQVIADGPFAALSADEVAADDAVVGAQRPELTVRKIATMVGVAADEGADVVACLLPGRVTAARARAPFAPAARRARLRGRQGAPATTGRVEAPAPAQRPPTTLAVRLSAEANTAARRCSRGRSGSVPLTPTCVRAYSRPCSLASSSSLSSRSVRRAFSPGNPGRQGRSARIGCSPATPWSIAAATYAGDRVRGSGSSSGATASRHDDHPGTEPASSLNLSELRLRRSGQPGW